MKFRTYRKLKNVILSIIVQFWFFLSCLSSFQKNIKVGKNKNLFNFFLEGNKNWKVGTKKNKKKTKKKKKKRDRSG